MRERKLRPPVLVPTKQAIERDKTLKGDYRSITEASLISMANLDANFGMTTDIEFWVRIKAYLKWTENNQLTPLEISQIPFCGYAEAEVMVHQEYTRHVDDSTKAGPVETRPLFYDSALNKLRFVAITTPRTKNLCLWVDDSVLNRMRQNGMLYEPQAVSNDQ